VRAVFTALELWCSVLISAVVLIQYLMCAQIVDCTLLAHLWMASAVPWVTWTFVSWSHILRYFLAAVFIFMRTNLGQKQQSYYLLCFTFTTLIQCKSYVSKADIGSQQAPLLALEHFPNFVAGLKWSPYAVVDLSKMSSFRYFVIDLLSWCSCF